MKFFDGYIIPLAQKLKECNVFGVSSEECLNYAVRNRDEWHVRGRAIVAEYVQSFTEQEENAAMALRRETNNVFARSMMKPDFEEAKEEEK